MLWILHHPSHGLTVGKEQNYIVKSATRRHSTWCHIRIWFCQTVSWHYYMVSPWCVFCIPVTVCYAPSFGHSSCYLLYLHISSLKIKRFFMSPLSSFHKLKQRSSTPDFPLKQTLTLCSLQITFTFWALWDILQSRSAVPSLSADWWPTFPYWSSGNRHHLVQFQCKCWLQVDGCPSGDGRKDGHGDKYSKCYTGTGAWDRMGAYRHRSYC